MIDRRRPGRPDRRNYYLAWGPADSPVKELVLVPGARWQVDEAIKLGKSACGLADYEVRDPDTHTRVRHDRIDESGVVTLRLAGRLHHIGVGRTHARTHVILLVADLHVRVVAATTGELPRELIIDPTRDYQPQNRKKPPNP